MPTSKQGLVALTARFGRLSEASPWHLLAPATIISFFLSGYVPLLNNNIYHVPILLKSYDLPQFTDDGFIQSLRYFSSGFWILFAGAGRYIDVKLFLALWLFISHLAFLASCLLLAKSLGLRDNRQLNLFLFIISSCPSLSGETLGGGGMMINYFTHSELANAPLLAGFAFALSRRYSLAALAVCITFFLNAFMAVWMLPSLALLAIYQISRGHLPLKRFLKGSAAGLATGSVFPIMPIWNILSNPDLRTPGNFGYQDFLWNFYPFHFFVSSLNITGLAVAIASVLALLLSTKLYGRHSAEFLMISLGAVMLLVLAAIVPLVTDSRMILNLHLVRAFVVVAMLTGISLAIITSRWLIMPPAPVHKPLALVLFCSLLLFPYPAAIAICIIAIGHAVPQHRWLGTMFQSTKTAVATCLVLAFTVLPFRAYAAFLSSTSATATEDRWERIGAWAGSHTPVNSSFKVPSVGALGFSYASNRSIWTNWKYGAAVMWSPSYFQTWEPERRNGFNLSLTNELKPSGEHQVDYLVAVCNEIHAQDPEYRDDDICVYGLDRTKAVGVSARAPFTTTAE